MGQVAVAGRDLRAAHQETIDGGHQAAEQGAGGQEADGCSLGHFCSLFSGADQLRIVIWAQIMYTRCQNQLTCLHSSNYLFATQQMYHLHSQ